MRIIDYDIITEQNCAKLVQSVNEAISRGWQPMGELVFTKELRCQAMVKYENEQKMGVENDWD